MNIYVASSWKNEFHPIVVQTLRGCGIGIYDFKDSEGFGWHEVNPTWKTDGHGMTEFKQMLEHPRAEQGFARDFEAMEWADKFILVLPCGRSAHLEAGWAIGKSKPTAIYIPKGKYDGPDLMYKMADIITDDIHNLIEWSFDRLPVKA